MEITSDTTVLITGATGGIGHAIAKAFHETGAKLVLTGRRAEALAPLAEATGARSVIADLGDRAQLLRCLEEAGPIDVLVANAALPSSGALMTFSDEEIDRSLDVNLRAPLVMARRAAVGMMARGRGHIVFISSVAGKVAAPGSALYSATKFGLRGAARALREDLRPHGVGITTIFPGFIRDAGMFADAKVELPRGIGTRSPEEVARAVVRGVRKNIAEITVAAVDQAFGAFLAGVSPGLVIWIMRTFGGEKISKRIADGQANKR